MVDDSGQLYTIEGIAASILMIITAYLVISSTTVFTPQDIHITDMQLEQLGHDALVIMDTPSTIGGTSNLSQYISSYDQLSFKEAFRENYSHLINSRVFESDDVLKFNASLSYRDYSTNKVENIPLTGDQYYRENAVKVTQWVNIGPDGADPLKNKVVLVEVLLWRS